MSMSAAPMAGRRISGLTGENVVGLAVMAALVADMAAVVAAGVVRVVARVVAGFEVGTGLSGGWV